MNHWHDEYTKPVASECPTLREVIEALEKEFPSPPKPKHIPRSLPDWMKAEGCCEIDARDERWGNAGHEIH